jgi:hypothetical protein
MPGSVSLCVVSDCIFNSNNQCQANVVQVARHAAHADCETFTPRRRKEQS